MSDTTDRRRTMSTWHRLWDDTRRLAHRMAGAARRTLDNHSPELARAPIRSTGDRTMSDDTTGDTMPATTCMQATREATSVRHVRVGDAAWREAATRAKREGRGVAEVVRALVTAYAAGDLEAPAPTQTSADRPVVPGPAPVRRLCDPTDQHVDPPPTLAGYSHGPKANDRA